MIFIFIFGISVRSFILYKIFMIFVFFILSNCSVAPSEDAQWLSLISGTKWQSGSDNLIFDSTGKSASINLYVYTYDESPSHQSGIYFTQFTLSPIHWFLLEKSDTLLTQYGPFLSKGAITKNTTNITMFNPLSS